jgi:hypothetical protein
MKLLLHLCLLCLLMLGGLVPPQATAQNNLLDAKFGGRIGMLVYRPRLGNAARPPRAGLLVGGNANLALGRNGLIHLMPEFGYMLANSREYQNPFNPFLSNVSGLPFPDGTSVNIISHFLQGALLLKFCNNSQETFGLYFGPAFHYMINQTLVFEQPVPGQEETLQEIQSGLNDEMRQVFTNFYLGAEARFTPVTQAVGVYGFIHSIHQVDEDPHLPAGFAIGAKLLW